MSKPDDGSDAHSPDDTLFRRRNCSGGHHGTVCRLPKRHDFLRLRNAPSWRAPAFILVCGGRPETHGAKKHVDGQCARVGYTVTKKMGNAVKRNRIKRRLRAVVAQTASHFRCDHDYILIARPVALTRPMGDMEQDLLSALGRVHAKLPETSLGDT